MTHFGGKIFYKVLPMKFGVDNKYHKKYI